MIHFFLLFMVLSFFNTTKAYRNDNIQLYGKSYVYVNEQKPRITVSTGPVHPFILQGAFDCYSQTCNEIQNQHVQQQIIASNDFLNSYFQAKKEQIYADIQIIQQKLDTCFDEKNLHKKTEFILDFFTLSVSEPELHQLLQETKKELAKYLVDSQGIIQRPNSKQKQKIKQILKTFYQKLDHYRKNSDSIIATHLMNAVSSGSLDDFLIHKYSSSVSLPDNKTNTDFYRVLQFSRNNEFDKAAPIVKHYQQKVQAMRNCSEDERERGHAISHEIWGLYNHYFNPIYDGFGIDRRFKNDPEYAAHNTKLKATATPNHQYNNYLAERARAKDQLLKDSAISSSELNDRIAYTLLDIEKKNGKDAAIHYLVSYLSTDTADITLRNAYASWFTADGLPRVWRMNSNLNLQMPTTIGQAQYALERELLFKFASLDQNQEYDKQGIRQGIHFIQRTCENAQYRDCYRELSQITLEALSNDVSPTIIQCTAILAVPTEYQSVVDQSVLVFLRHIKTVYDPTACAQETYKSAHAIYLLNKLYGALNTSCANQACQELRSIVRANNLHNIINQSSEVAQSYDYDEGLDQLSQIYEEYIDHAADKDSLQCKRYEARSHALKEFHAGNKSMNRVQYAIDHTANFVINLFRLPTQSYEFNYGNIVQQVIHGELLNAFKTLGTQLLSQPDMNGYFARTIVELIDCARENNQYGHIVKALRLSEAGHGLLSLRSTVIEIARETCARTLESTFDMIRYPPIEIVTHPVETVCAVNNALSYAAIQMFHVLVDAQREVKWKLKNKPGPYEPVYPQTYTNYQDAVHQLSSYVYNEPVECIKDVTAFAADAYLGTKVFDACFKFARDAARMAKRQAGILGAKGAARMRALVQAPEAVLLNELDGLVQLSAKYHPEQLEGALEHIAQKAEVLIAPELSAAEQIEAAINTLEKEAVAAVEQTPRAAEESLIIKPSYVSPANITMEHAIEKSGIELLKTHIPELREIIAQLKNKFGETINFEGHNLRINYEHWLMFDIKHNYNKKSKKYISRLSGFHHDYLGKLEKSGFIQFTNIKQGLHGTFKADVIINGMIFEGKTFYPGLWSQEKVTEKIFESFTNIQEKLQKGDVYKVIGKTKEDIQIESIIDMLNNEIKTIYPLVE